MGKSLFQNKQALRPLHVQDREGHGIDAQDLDSDQQGNLGQPSADTDNVYQFKCALRLIAKPQLEKGSPLGIQQNNQF